MWQKAACLEEGGDDDRGQRGDEPGESGGVPEVGGAGRAVPPGVADVSGRLPQPVRGGGDGM